MSNSRIDALEAELAREKAKNTAFEVRLSALEAPKRSPVRPEPPIEGTRVSYPAPQSNFVIPSNAELLKLMDVVLSKYPEFFPKHVEEAEYGRQFSAAFKAFGHFRRTDVPNKKYYPQHWLDEAETLLKSWGDHTDIRPAFMGAIIAHFDIPFSDWKSDGVVLELGLDMYAGRAATDKWRRVLAGEVPRPVASPASRNYPTPQFRVTAA
jgi:hypothetical protein